MEPEPPLGVGTLQALTLGVGVGGAVVWRSSGLITGPGVPVKSHQPPGSGHIGWQWAGGGCLTPTPASFLFVSSSPSDIPCCCRGTFLEFEKNTKTPAASTGVPTRGQGWSRAHVHGVGVRPECPVLVRPRFGGRCSVLWPAAAPGPGKAQLGGKAASPSSSPHGWEELPGGGGPGVLSAVFLLRPEPCGKGRRTAGVAQPC